MNTPGSEQPLKLPPNLEAVCDAIAKKSPFQKKSLRRILEAADDDFFVFAEDWLGRLIAASGEGATELAESYIDYTKMIRVEEMHFTKDGKYRYDDYAEVYDRIYSQEDHMSRYVTGLGMTQVFWPNHYQIVRFFLDRFIPKIGNATRGAEIGVGHGFFHSEMLRAAPELSSDMLDVSPVALEFTRKVIGATGSDPSRANARLVDVQKEIPLEPESLDVLLMGEIIEHLEEGKSVMTAMADKMKPSGLCFFTTAANAPAEDHILLFRTAGEIRSFLNECGWEAEEEHLGTLRDMSVEEAEEGGHNINYAAILRPSV